MKPISKVIKWMPVLLFALSAAPIAPATTKRDGEIQVEYRVKIASIDEQLFNVTVNVTGIKQPQVKLTLPVWIPGLYKAENYAKNIQRLKITDAKGARAPYRMTAMQSWLVDTTKLDRFTVEYEYRAETLAVNQAKVAKDFALFVGAELLPFVEGLQKTPLKLRVESPEGWRVITSLRETAEPGVYEAANYDDLAFAPVEVGKFDVTKFEAFGKPHFIVTTPAGAYSQENSQKLADLFERTVTEEGAIFGGLPYDKYVYFYFLSKPDWSLESSLGLSNAQIFFLRPGESPHSKRVLYIASHEHFHSWNINRIRPVELFPPNYSKMEVSPLLWVSEGFTNYFSRMARYRARLENRDGMLIGLREVIHGVENSEARKFISLADSSRLAWMEYETSKPFNTPTFMHGELIALLLDISIQRDTQGAASIEDVMRALYNDFYKRDKGFTTEDLVAIINRLTRRDYKDFFNKYVLGVDNPPYNDLLAAIGYQYERYINKTPSLGFRVVQTPEGQKINGVTPGSSAADAGLRVDDVVFEIDELDVRQSLAGARDWLVSKIGQVVKINIKRGDEIVKFDIKVGSRDEVGFRVSELPNATPIQLKAREVWLKRSEEKVATHQSDQNSKVQ